MAIAGQSGAIVMAIRQTLEDRGVGVGYMVTTGNETGLETPDLMAYFAADPSIRVIVVYLEGVRNTKVFREACKAARAAGKPVIALKLGASEGGRAAAMAHTGALAGSIETFDAISTREGVIRVRGLDELIETTECFVHADPPKSNRLAAVSLSGGKRGLLIDAFYSAGLNFAPLSANATEQLAKMLGPGSIVGNPLDAGFAAVVDPSVYMSSIKIMIGQAKGGDTVGFCLDTCHAHAGGEELVGLVDRVKAITGRIDLVHANDSRDAFDSGADRHANFGDGEVGTDALAEVVRTAAVPVVVETPGGREGQGSDIAWLKENV